MEEISLPQCKAWGTERIFTFAKIDDLAAWAQQERNFWEHSLPTNYESSNPWAPHLQNQIQQIAALASQAEAYKRAVDESSARIPKDLLSSLFNAIKSGTLLVSESRGADVVAEAIKSSPEVAALIYCSYRSDARNLVNNQGMQTLQIVRLAQFISPATYTEAAATSRDELARLKNMYEAEIEKLREHTEGQVAASESAGAAEKSAIADRQNLWEQTLAGYKGEWGTLKQTYDTELGLRAPTTYWTTRGKDSGKLAIKFFVAFAVCTSVLLGVFFCFAVPEIDKIKGGSPFISAISVVVPILVGVWILRVLARLFSENLKIQQDAKERETLVKTFLALMKDEATSGAISSDDRKVILQALFRQSSVTASDDAPPFTLFEGLKSVLK